MDTLKKIFLIGVIVLIPMAIFAQVENEEVEVIAEAVMEEESECDSLSFFFEAENGTEFGVGEGAGLENETVVTVGLEKVISDTLVIGGRLTNYSDLLEDVSSTTAEGDTEHFNSAYLAENRFAGYFDLGYSPTDWFSLGGSLGLEFNARPDDYTHAYRVGFGVALALGFDFSEHFLTFGVENRVTPVFGLGEGEATNTLILNDFVFELRFDVFNYIKEDLNLGLFVVSELAAETYYNATNAGTPLLLDHEFFTGLVYTPVDFFECNVAFAMYNCTENGSAESLDAELDGNATDLGILVGGSFSFENIAVGIDYRPRWNTESEVSHVLSVGCGLSI